MKKIIISIYLFIGIVCSLKAQPPLDVKIADLYIPEVPGFVLSDKAPASVDKPSNPRAFALNLLNLREGGALQVTPFWLVNQPAYTFDKWLGNKFPVLETFNLSTATFKTDTTSVVSIGFKSQVLRLYSKTSKSDISAKKNEIVKLATPKIDPATDEALDITAADSILIVKKLAELSELKKTGYFAIEIAGAILGASNNGSFKNLEAQKSGVWANLVLSPSIIPLNIVGVARYSWANNVQPKSSKDSSFLDFGLSLNYETKKLTLSGEILSRKDFSINKNYTRYAFVGNYALTENIVLVASIGKNFSDTENMITSFGIRFGLSRTKVSF